MSQQPVESITEIKGIGPSTLRKMKEAGVTAVVTESQEEVIAKADWNLPPLRGRSKGSEAPEGWLNPYEIARVTGVNIPSVFGMLANRGTVREVVPGPQGGWKLSWPWETQDVEDDSYTRGGGVHGNCLPLAQGIAVIRAIRALMGHREAQGVPTWEDPGFPAAEGAVLEITKPFTTWRFEQYGTSSWVYIYKRNLAGQVRWEDHEWTWPAEQWWYRHGYESLEDFQAEVRPMLDNLTLDDLPHEVRTQPPSTFLIGTARGGPVPNGVS